MHEVDRSRDSGALESGSNSSNHLPSAYYSTRTSFCQDSCDEYHDEQEESISLNYVPVNGNKILEREETEETMLDGSCDELGKTINKNNRLVTKS